jgi:hypothetical protein
MLDSPAAGFKTTNRPHSIATSELLVIRLMVPKVIVAESDHKKSVNADEIIAAYSTGANAVSFPMIRGAIDR